MSEPVEGGGVEQSIGEGVAPLGEVEVGGDCDGTAVVSLADDLEQQVGAGFIDGEIAEFVKQQSRSQVAAQVAFELTGGLGGGERTGDAVSLSAAVPGAWAAI